MYLKMSSAGLDLTTCRSENRSKPFLNQHLNWTGQLPFVLSFSSPLPVQAERVEESWEALHNQQNGDGQHSKEGKNHKKDHRSHIALPLKGKTHHHHPQDLWQLCGDTNNSPSDNLNWLEQIYHVYK